MEMASVLIAENNRLVSFFKSMFNVDVPAIDAIIGMPPVTIEAYTDLSVRERAALLADLNPWFVKIIKEVAFRKLESNLAAAGFDAVDPLVDAITQTVDLLGDETGPTVVTNLSGVQDAAAMVDSIIEQGGGSDDMGYSIIMSLAQVSSLIKQITPGMYRV